MSEVSRAVFPEFVVRELVYPAGRRMEWHAHDYSNITVVVSGDMEETTESGEHRGRSCSVLLKPAGTMHANHILGRQGTRTVSVEMRRSSALGAELQSLSWQWLEDPESARAAVAFYRAFRGGVRAEIESSSIALVATATSVARRATGAAPPWLAEVRAILDARFDEPVRFEALAADLGLHPVYLSRAFRRHTGVAMGEYVRSLRLRHARHLLSATSRSLAAISAEAGFTDASHLCRMFAGTHEVTPTAYRKLCESPS
ncbi:MAG TPA: helix-turn-helix domain-containing protein [Thermoanaerobaculia bacterium]|nr:helix-turn-helix domain-containing protein [Thermoanaerobaculia bacterium]